RLSAISRYDSLISSGFPARINGRSGKFQQGSAPRNDMMVLTRSAALAAGLLLIPALAPPAQAQTYPSKTVSLVVPFPAGGSTDWLSRLLGQKLEQRLKQPFIVENRAGGANLIAATAVAKAEPDGHTLLMTTSTTMAINVSVFKNLP